jgi:hypothetical protein
MAMKGNRFLIGVIGCLVMALMAAAPPAQGQVKKVTKTVTSTGDFHGFRVLADRGTELDLEVSYSYSGAFGENVAIGARMATDGEVSPNVSFRPDGASVGQRQTAKVTVSTNSETSFTSTQIVLQMYIGGSFVFLEEIVPYRKTWARTAAITMNIPRAVAMLAKPALVSPPDNSKFSHYPRATTLVWKSVGGAASYTVEVDCMHCCKSGEWCSEVGKPWKVVEGVTGTTFQFDFAGAQPGRWRVWAVGTNGAAGAKSEWWEFSFTK